MSEQTETERAIEILENEKICVTRQNTDMCDHNCGYCDLVKEDKEILDAYDTAVTALRAQLEAERLKEASANRLTQRNSLGRAVLIQEYMCEGCNDSTWSLGEITDRLAYFEENKLEAERKIEKVREYCKDKMKVQFETEYSEGYVNGTNNATNEIIKILEGAE